jgi:hypothetical protein
VNLDEPRTRYAVAVLGDVFPGSTVAPARAGIGRTATQPSADRVFALAPSGTHPRLLVPVRPRDAAAAALRAYGGRLTRRAQLGYAAAARVIAATGTGALRARLAVSPAGSGSDALDQHLSDVLGREVSIAVHLTPARANRKPVVQALARGERRPVAFAKLAVDPLTSALVAREAAALTDIGARHLEHVVVPEVLDHGRFAGRESLVMQPLPTWLPGRSPDLADASSAAHEVARLNDPVRQPLAESAYWHDVQRQTVELPAGPRAARLADAVERLTRDAGQRVVTFTASHGDWSPWNMWQTERGLLVWDWERFETATPAGLDLLHFRLNDQLIRKAWSRDAAGHRLLAEAPEILALDPYADAAAPTALLYLVHLGLRYERDGQAAAGAALGRLDEWLLPAVEAGLAEAAVANRG